MTDEEFLKSIEQDLRDNLETVKEKETNSRYHEGYADGMREILRRVDFYLNR